MIKENYDKCESCGLYKHIEYKIEGLYYCTECYHSIQEDNDNDCKELDFDE